MTNFGKESNKKNGACHVCKNQITKLLSACFLKVETVTATITTTTIIPRVTTTTISTKTHN